MTKRNENLSTIKFRNFIKRNIFLIGFFGIIIIVGVASLSIDSIKNDNNNNNKNKTYGDDVIEMYYFHWTLCSHCKEQNKFNEKLIKKYPNLKIIEFEVTEDGSEEKYKEIAQNFEELPNDKIPGTPLTIIGNEYNIGYGKDETTGKKLEDLIIKENIKINENWDENTMI
ncbi:MAG: hypothetical protein KC589_01615, partial [Nanoarchaeota archaeon]|nr:hypothetical protein [Nanoarchaeota archaeon]